MIMYYKRNINSKRNVEGKGLVNKFIDYLPVELHLPGYQFCGPGTKLNKRLLRGDKGINPLDSACRDHDIAYSENIDIDKRHQADRELAEKAWRRVKAKDSSLGEKINSYIVTNAMKAKVKFGMGMDGSKKKNKMCGKKLFNNAIKAANIVLRKEKPEDINNAIKIARKTIQKTFRGKKAKIIIPRIINVPKTGGFLPLIPIITALGALGTLATGGSAIAKAVISTKNAKKQLEESVRHNKAMESISMGKGLFLKPYKKGYGIFLPRRPLTDIDLKLFGKKYISFFRGVYMRDKLPVKAKSRECGIINLDTYKGPGSHWVAYNKNKDNAEYFDSFGNLQPPVEVLKYLGNNVTYNYERKQQFNSYNCGHLCLKYLCNLNK
ncbi:hypothetical protein CVS40_5184 [Lucilia cuprina]|nr:hypothetical protein CVS40_5184 [Lucilia cuprina]